jgi:hypothetical protein
VAVLGVLTEIGSAATRGHSHRKSAPFVIENESVLAAILNGQRRDFAFCELHKRFRFG